MKDVNDLAGLRLGDYTLLYKLASGGMAHIYIGEDERLGRKAAVKILTADMAGDDDLLTDRFLREARAIAQLEHDNIIPIYQFGESDDLYYLAMRYVEGNDLADEMKKYKQQDKLIEVERMLTILEQVAQALDYAHAKGIVHRDVKPSNILLGDHDKAFLSDFGLVLWQSVDQTLGTAFGTPRYISPEQATDSQSAVPQSDIYSLAVIVYELLTGKVLFSGATPMEVALSHITERPTPPRAHNPAIPAAAQNEILRALQKDAAQRHPTAMEFIRTLQRAYGLLDVAQAASEAHIADGGTIPLAPESLSKRAAAAAPANSALESWDAPAPDEDHDAVMTLTDKDAPAAPVGIPAPKPAAGTESRPVKTRSRWLPIVAMVGVLLLVGGGLFLSGAFAPPTDDAPNAPGDRPAAEATAATDAPLIAAGLEAAPLQMRYSDDFFAILNQHPTARFDVSRLAIEGDSGEVFRDVGQTLLPGACVVVRRSNTREGDLPQDWGCEASRSVVVSGNAFWQANASDDQRFRLRDEDSVAGGCDTVGRAVGRTDAQSCTVDWSRFVSD